jgi:hypothetical protein
MSNLKRVRIDILRHEVKTGNLENRFLYYIPLKARINLNESFGRGLETRPYLRNGQDDTIKTCPWISSKQFYIRVGTVCFFI